MRSVGAIAAQVAEGLAQERSSEQPLPSVPVRFWLTQPVRKEAHRLDIAGAQFAPVLGLLTTLVAKYESLGQGPASPEVLTILTFARLIKANLKCSEHGERHYAWSIGVAQSLAPTADRSSIREGVSSLLREVVLSPHFVVPEVERACTEIASRTGQDEWPSLRELLKTLRDARLRSIEKATQDVKRTALPARAVEHPDSRRRMQAWASVVRDVASGRVKSDDISQREEVERRLRQWGAGDEY